MSTVKTEYDLAREIADKYGAALPLAVLVDHQIRDYIAPRMFKPGERATTFAEGTSGRGIISYGLSSAGYDFRLGEAVKVFSNAHSPIIDPLDIDPRAFVDLVPRHSSRRWPNPLGAGHPEIERDYRYVIIPPNGYILGETVEYIDIPRDVIIVVLGKSTYARSGIIVNCTPLEPGWRGRVTLEIANVSNVPAKVYLDMGIAQALFFKLGGVPEKTYDKKAGKYQDQKGLEFAKS